VKGLLVLVAAFAAAATLTATASAAGRDTFAGIWVAVESPVGDGSTDVMAIGRPRADGSRTWLYYETYATFCGGGPLTAAGTALADGDVLTVTVTFTRCANGSAGAVLPPFTIVFTAVGDGLDFGGLVFTRLGAG